MLFLCSEKLAMLRSYAKCSHAVSGHMPRHDEVAESMPKANEDGVEDVHCPSGL